MPSEGESLRHGGEIVQYRLDLIWRQDRHHLGQHPQYLPGHVLRVFECMLGGLLLGVFGLVSKELEDLGLRDATARRSRASVDDAHVAIDDDVLGVTPSIPVEVGGYVIVVTKYGMRTAEYGNPFRSG